MKTCVLVSLLCVVSLAACGGHSARGGQRSEPQAVARWGYSLVASYPHDTEAYTQGLFWYDGSLWESTGEYGRSAIRRVDLETGSVEAQTRLPNEFFGEGAALLGDRIFQLTWMENRAFVWDPATLELTGQFTYRGDGWGLATDGTSLYMSDGSANVSVLDPATFRPTRTFQVRHEGELLRNINEMEWIDGRLWANIYLTNEIAVIDPSDGRVEALIDLSGLIAQLVITPSTDFMNGIAHDPSTGRIWVTGKRWDKLFEVRIVR